MPASDDAVPVPPGPLDAEKINNLIQAAIQAAFGPETIQTLVRAIVDKVGSSTAIQCFHPATVIADTDDGSSHTATLIMDGDAQGTVTNAAVLLPQILFPGERIMVWFDKPHVAYVIGVIGIPRPPLLRVTDYCGGEG